MQKILRYNNDSQKEFVGELQSKVKDYFKVNQIDVHSNSEMHIKTFVMLGLYLIPFVLIILNVFTNPVHVFILWMIMAVGMSGIGLSIMHDANHGAYSNKKRINHIMGLLINLLGASHINWKVQHNVLHHTYPNIDGYDDSLHGGKLFRFSPNQKRLKHHKYQHLYAWPLYSLQTISWVISSDFVRLKNYNKMGLLKSYGKTYERLLTELILWKAFYFIVFFAVPITLSVLPWWQTLSFYFIMQLCVGFFLTCVFIVAHIMPDCDFPLPNENGKMDNNFAIHQMYTSCNFATGSRWFSWYLGGLNYQTEHHLFPNICHVHYPAISKILKETAGEYKLPYFHHKTFVGAIYEHGKMLRMMGRSDRKENTNFENKTLALKDAQPVLAG
ncbi:MAG: fatty acid desaturase family protein [Candidatus Cyclobacteriaceae bacterium M2_1C_046]